MTDVESTFLAKNYKAFLYEYLHNIKSGTDSLHLHPPQAFRRVYEIILSGFVKPDDDGELRSTDLITMMDMVAKFVSYLNHNGIEYDSFSQCSCTRLTDKDLELLLEGGGER